MMAATWAHAALRPQSQIFGNTIVAGENPREIAFTYDDGPNDRSTEPLLALLDEFGVKASFFMIGRFVQARPDLARKVFEAGHVVANHTHDASVAGVAECEGGFGRSWAIASGRWKMRLAGRCGIFVRRTGRGGRWCCGPRASWAGNGAMECHGDGLGADRCAGDYREY